MKGVLILLYEEKENEFLELLKQMPRQELSPQTRNKILNHLKTMNRKVGIRNKWYTLIKRLVISIFILALIVSIPYLVKKINQINFTSIFLPDNHSHAWDISPKFDLLKEDKTIIYANRVIGIEGKIGYLESGDFVANAPENGSKIFWYVWGDSQELSNAHLVAKAVNRDTGAIIDLDDSIFGDAVSPNGSDAAASALTSFKPFPRKGLWRIDITINDKPYGSIVVQVKDEYIHTKTTKFLLSKDDAVVGGINTYLVVPEHTDAQTIEVSLFPIKDKNSVHNSVFQHAGKYNKVDDGRITMYTGVLQFDEPGKWQVEILGEKTIINVKQQKSVK
jgi:hypothetical protein